MKDELLALVGRMASPRAANVAREWLQAAALESLARSGAMTALAFHGGTALRFLYGIRRFSEDLDFSWHAAETRTEPDMAPWLARLKQDLWREGVPVRIGLARRARKHEARIEFSVLAEELDLPAINIKLELSVAPPLGAGFAVSVCRLHRLVRVRHYDPATLLAGKLHAVLQRHYSKGRDYFDLVWYLADRAWPEPNLDFLNAALRQSGWTRAPLTAASWRDTVLDRLTRVDWRAARADVLPFLEEPRDVDHISFEAVAQLLQAPRRDAGRDRR